MRQVSTGLCAALLASTLAASASAQAPCPGSLNGDRLVNADDLGILLNSWGGGGIADLDGNGIVDGDDLGELLARWGPCPKVTPPWATLVEALPDPAVVTDPVLRGQIIATGWAWRIRDTRTEIEMLLIPRGSFQRGCSPSLFHPCSSGENPRHQVSLSRDFYLGRFEVTQRQWQNEMGSNPSSHQAATPEVPFTQVPLRPVERVSLSMIQAFNSQTGMRLPSEAEWEYSYRAGTATAFHGFAGYWSGTDSDALAAQIAWTEHNSVSQTRPVGSKLPNGFGLHDMAGNVFEVVADWAGPYSAGAQVDPTGPASGVTRVLRGGSWGNNRDYVRASNRDAGIQEGQVDSGVGFRVARTP